MSTKHFYRFMSAVTLATAAMGLAACAGMSQQEKNTAIGAGVGAIGGSILTGGSTTGTVGGAAVGGVIGHEIDKSKDAPKK
ncbi:glycine zipper 2TM domain-containing protein [Limnohabitans sp. DM1]|uniref:glycine zipper 2TM domain-containing protein n=1 Tax=Limnohabitans sp. DM1 TaxID=1597955 RepID=UPI000B01A4CA|nr:glycine zipper 2TM domain-containing protein [Limnohabitans sp. DM1]